MSEMRTGSIVFGPRREPSLVDEARELSRAWQHAEASANPRDVWACNCIGPQPGETKCPCMLRAESAQGSAMIRDGVVINGRRYRLVPADVEPRDDR